MMANPTASGVVQLRDLLARAEAGALVLPATPASYTRPRDLR